MAIFIGSTTETICGKFGPSLSHKPPTGHSLKCLYPHSLSEAHRLSSIPHFHPPSRAQHSGDGMESCIKEAQSSSSAHLSLSLWHKLTTHVESHWLSIPTTGHWIEWTAMASTVHHSIARRTLTATAKSFPLHRRLHTNTHLLRLLRH